MITPQTTIKLTSKNQLTVPAAVARQLKLKPGDHLSYKVEGKKLTLEPKKDPWQALAKLQQENAKLIKGFASDESIKQSVRDHFASQPRP